MSIGKHDVVMRVLPHRIVEYGGRANRPGDHLIVPPKDAKTLTEQGVAEEVPLDEVARLVEVL